MSLLWGHRHPAGWESKTSLTATHTLRSPSCPGNFEVECRSRRLWREEWADRVCESKLIFSHSFCSLLSCHLSLKPNSCHDYCDCLLIVCLCVYLYMRGLCTANGTVSMKSWQSHSQNCTVHTCTVITHSPEQICSKINGLQQHCQRKIIKWLCVCVFSTNTTSTATTNWLMSVDRLMSFNCQSD